MMALSTVTVFTKHAYLCTVTVYIQSMFMRSETRYLSTQVVAYTDRALTPLHHPVVTE